MFRREFAHCQEHDLKNHVSPVRFRPSAQSTFAGLFVALSFQWNSRNWRISKKNDVTEDANHTVSGAAD